MSIGSALHFDKHLYLSPPFHVSDNYVNLVLNYEKVIILKI